MITYLEQLRVASLEGVAYMRSKAVRRTRCPRGQCFFILGMRGGNRVLEASS